MSYQGLSNETVIELSVDFIKHGHKIPVELQDRLELIGMKDVLMPLEEDDD